MQTDSIYYWQEINTKQLHVVLSVVKTYLQISDSPMRSLVWTAGIWFDYNTPRGN